MQARGRGRIAINASLAGYFGLPQATAYGGTKAALINMAQSLRLMLEPRGIAVQVVNPGFVKTPLSDGNAAAMPFLVPLDEAARRICDGFERGGFEITFPRRLAWPMKAINLLPYPLYFRLVGRITRAGGKPARSRREASGT
jgi:short-subunit dehydrogenase